MCVLKLLLCVPLRGVCHSTKWTFKTYTIFLKRQVIVALQLLSEDGRAATSWLQVRPRKIFCCCWNLLLSLMSALLPLTCCCSHCCWCCIYCSVRYYHDILRTWGTIGGRCSYRCCSNVAAATAAAIAAEMTTSFVPICRCSCIFFNFSAAASFFAIPVAACARHVTAGAAADACCCLCMPG